MSLPTAATITIRQTLELLDSSFAALAEGVAQCRYTFWLGSGISRERVADLRAVARKILEYLRAHIDPSRPNCPYRLALREAFRLANITDADESRIDLTRPINEWPSIDTILSNLTQVYSRLLDIRVSGHAEPDFLLWEVVNVRETYALLATPPDCEHLCLGILIMEGVLPDVATANWDGLIESAVNELGGPASGALCVCVIPRDLRSPPLLTRLFKFHGCALRAADDPTVYRPHLIARYSQITAWQHDAEYSLMREQLVNLATTKPTLMIGLSAQDTNIQGIFARARSQMPWEWPCNPPAHVFTEDSLGNDQRNILRVVYREAYDANSVAVEAGCLFRAYAKPALTALVLHVLCTKLRTFVSQVYAPHLADSDKHFVADGIVVLRNRISLAGDGDRLAFIRLLIAHVAKFMAMFQEGTHDNAPPPRYRPVSTNSTSRIPHQTELSTSGMRELACSLGVLGQGEVRGYWVVDTCPHSDPRTGALRLTAGAVQTRCFFAANAQAELRMSLAGWTRHSDNDAIIIHSTTPESTVVRSPVSALGRTGTGGLRHVCMAELLNGARNGDHLMQRFRELAVI